MFDFEWDEAKRFANVRKHGIDFEVAEEIFDGRPMLTSRDFVMEKFGIRASPFLTAS